jgi:hypothetical protein
LLAITVFATIFVKQFAARTALIRNLPKIDAKVVPDLVLKCTKSKLNHAIRKQATKVGSFGLKIDMQYAL